MRRTQLGFLLLAALAGCDDGDDSNTGQQGAPDAALTADVGMGGAGGTGGVGGMDPDAGLGGEGGVEPDAAPDATPDADADAGPEPDLGGPDLGGPDSSVDAGPAPDMAADMAVVEPDQGVPEACAPWVGLADQALLTALHTELHDRYQPVEVTNDLGGNPNRYTTARYLMFTEVEFMERDGQAGYECAYTGTFVPGEPGVEPDNDDMNCEHTWPRARMADRASLLYSHQQSDIHHLLPTLPGVNSLRGSFYFGEPVHSRNLDYAPSVQGVDEENHAVFEPRDERKGDVARVIFYFSVRWGRSIVDWEEETLKRWHREDPVDARERGRNDAIEGLQGNRNPFIDCPQLADQIADFREFPILDTNETLPAP